MRRTTFFIGMLAAMAATDALAQRIDFNNYGRKEAEGLETGYTAWTFGRVVSDTKQFATANGDTITITLSAVEGLKGNGIRTNYWKNGVVDLGYRLIGDMCNVTTLLAPGVSNDTEEITEGSSGLQLTIDGLSAGEHTILAYHNITDGYTGDVAPLDVEVNGTTVATGIQQTVRAAKPATAGYSYIQFECQAGETVIVKYITKPEDGKSYDFTGAVLNALVFDEVNPLTMASEPSPSNQEWHVDADEGSCVLSWKASETAVKHHLYIGTSADGMQEVAALTDTTYTLTDLYNLNTYYWRVDEEAADGTVYTGDQWAFRPRHLAFPSAEGYGRFATGGRGGVVYHVTNLNDDNQPGSFRYGIENISEPRTIVFDVSGYIALRGKLQASGDFITIAGQTAPGKGICFGGAAMGFSNDQIIRNIRNRVGSGETSDGMGMRGANHCIMDHCSISWSIDEGFSSREAGNITLQRTMISEALNIANHNKYSDGSAHGFAAVFGGDIGSFHHNLLSQNSGRNPRLDGGMDGSGAYKGRLDIFNNVVYNWNAHPAYGESHEANFHNNYYKMGPATGRKWILRADVNQRGSNTGTESYYYMGNVLTDKNGKAIFDGTKHGDGSSTDIDGGMWQLVNEMTVDWKVWVDEPFYPSYANVQTATEAYKNVMSDVSMICPMIDEHDKRIIKETLNGTATYKGSVSGLQGLIDSETDCGGYEVYPEVSRPEGFDTDQDGMPDWWEELVGTDKNAADNNGDPDRDGYTNIEDYLNWMGEPHIIIQPLKADTVNFKDFFAGYTASPAYTVEYSGSNLSTTTLNDTLLVITSTAENGSLETVSLTVTDSEGSTMTRQLGVAVTADTSYSGIQNVMSDMLNDVESYEVYTLGGVLVKKATADKGKNAYNLNLQGIGHGTFVVRTTDSKGAVHTMKIIK